MFSFLEQRSWALLLAIFVVGGALAFAIGYGGASAAFGKVIMSGWWTWAVLVQLVLQVAIAGLSQFAEGKQQDRRGAALFAFSVSLAAFAAIADIPWKTFFAHVDGPAYEPGTSLFETLACSFGSSECATVYGTVGSIAGGVMFLVAAYAAVRLRRSDTRQVDFPWGLVMAATVGTAFTFLLVYEWRGSVLHAPPSSPALQGSSEAADGSWQNAIGLGAVFAFCLLHGFAALTIAAIRRGAVPRLTGLNLIGEIGWFVVAVIVLLAVVVAVMTAAGAAILMSFDIVRLVAASIAWFFDNLGGAVSATLPTVPLPNEPPSSSVPASVQGQSDFTLWAAAGALGVLVLARAHLVPVGAYVLDGLLAAAAWSSAKLSAFIAARRLALLGIAIAVLAVRLMSPADEVEPSDDGDVRVPQYTEVFGFAPAPVDCRTAVASERLRWAFDSDDSVALAASDCSISFDGEPTTVLAVGLASGDDTVEGGFQLSSRRSANLAAMARRQYPNAVIIVAAMGREKNAPTGLRGADLFAYGRPMVFMVSTDVVPHDLRHPPMSDAISDALGSAGLLDSYEACWLAVFQQTELPPTLPYPVTAPRCRWSSG